MRSKWTVIEYGSEFPIEKKEGQSVVDGKATVYTRSGRDSLRLVASTLSENGCREVLLPCYCCESMESPFVDAGMKVQYYQIQEGLKLDIADIESKLSDTSHAVLLYMDYYAIPSVGSSVLQDLKQKYSLTLIKDATHDWLDYDLKDRALLDDFTIVSLRKWAGLPEGGLVFSSVYPLTAAPESDGVYGTRRSEAMRLKLEYLENGDVSSKPVYLKKLGDCNSLLDELHETASMGELSRALCGGVDWVMVAAVRRKNAAALAEGLEQLGISHYYQQDTAPLWVPFVPKCNRDALQAAMNLRDLYCPYLWSIPGMAKGCSIFVDHFVSEMLCLPCDQRYDEGDMRAMIKILAESIKEVAHE